MQQLNLYWLRTNSVLRDGVRRGVPDIFANFANADMVAHAMTDGDRFDDVVKGLLVRIFLYFSIEHFFFVLYSYLYLNCYFFFNCLFLKKC